jgi:hypothetical protein
MPLVAAAAVIAFMRLAQFGKEIQNAIEVVRSK